MRFGEHAAEIAENKRDYRERIEKHFAATTDLFARYWHPFFHFALFAEPDETWESAFERTHTDYLARIRAHESKKILVLACGRGAFAQLIARETGADVLGVDLSRAQLSFASKEAPPNLRLKHHDIMEIDTLDEQFDAAVFLDAACYLPDKGAAAKRIRKVLRPGARMLLVDWCKAEGLSMPQEEIVLDPLLKYWCLPGLETPASWRKNLERAGFEIEHQEDLNDQVRPNWELAYDNGLRGITELSMSDLPGMIWKGLTLGPEAITMMKEQFPAALYIKAGFETGFLRYASFTARAR